MPLSSFSLTVFIRYLAEHLHTANQCISAMVKRKEVSITGRTFTVLMRLFPYRLYLYKMQI